MNVLYLEGRRSGYTPDQCGQTMTVSELIDFLGQFDGTLPVYLNNDDGYTFGEVSEDSFTESEYDEEY